MWHSAMGGRILHSVSTPTIPSCVVGERPSGSSGRSKNPPETGRYLKILPPKGFPLQLFPDLAINILPAAIWPTVEPFVFHAYCSHSTTTALPSPPGPLQLLHHSRRTAPLSARTERDLCGFHEKYVQYTRSNQELVGL